LLDVERLLLLPTWGVVEEDIVAVFDRWWDEMEVFVDPDEAEPELSSLEGAVPPTVVEPQP
jgi:hypothetical protein